MLSGTKGQRTLCSNLFAVHSFLSSPFSSGSSIGSFIDDDDDQVEFVDNEHEGAEQVEQELD